MHKNFIAGLAGIYSTKFDDYSKYKTYYSYLPLAHIY